MIVVWDTETTGLRMPSVGHLEKQPRIIEFAAAILDPKTYKVKREFTTLINPEQPITPEITKITGLTDDDLRQAPLFIEALPEIERCFLGNERMIAHNLPFDHGMLVDELRRLGREFAFPYPPNQCCTVQLTQHLLGRNAKLVELYQKIIGKPLQQTHRALDDVRALVEIIQKERY